MKSVKRTVKSQNVHNLILEKSGFVTSHSIFGALGSDICIERQVTNAKIHTFGAQAFNQAYNMSVDDYESLAVRCKYFGKIPSECRTDEGRTTHDKYRSIDGRGNNLRNPYWGASNTPFTRFGGRNYEDGIYAIKKSVNGSDLPNARLLVQEVLTKAVRSPPPSLTYNLIGLLIILFATHDLHYQVYQSVTVFTMFALHLFLKFTGTNTAKIYSQRNSLLFPRQTRRIAIEFIEFRLPSH